MRSTVAIVQARPRSSAIPDPHRRRRISPISAGRLPSQVVRQRDPHRRPHEIRRVDDQLQLRLRAQDLELLARQDPDDLASRVDEPDAG